MVRMSGGSLVVKHSSNDSGVSPASRNPLTTVTHARIRIQQGDLGSARRILRAIVESHPRHPEAVALLDGLSRPGASAPAKAEATPASPEEIDASEPDTPEIVVDRLSRWLDRIKRNAGEGGV